MSSLKQICPHCGSGMDKQSVADQERIKARRLQHQLRQAARLTYLAMVVLISGAVWWWFSGAQGWVFPPPVGGASLILLGVVLYLLARAWVVFLRLKRNRS